MLLIVPFVLQVVGITGLVGYLSYCSGQKAVTDLADQLIESTSDRVKDRLDSFLGNAQKVLAISKQALESQQLDDTNFKQLENYFFQTLPLYDDFTAIGLGNTQGEALFIGHDRRGILTVPGSWISGETTNRYPKENRLYRLDAQGKRIELVQTVHNYDPRQITWYKIAAKNGKPSWTPIYPLLLAPLASSAAVAPVYKNQQLRGVLSVTVSLNDISEFLNHLDFSPNGQIFVIERSGDLIATSTLEKTYAIHLAANQRKLIRLNAVKSQDGLTQATAKALLTHFGSFKKIRPSKFDFVDTVSLKQGKQARQRYFANVTSYQDKYGLDWLIVTVVPEFDFMGEIYRNWRQTLLLCGVALSTSLGFGIWTARRITHPLVQLTRATEAFASGHLDRPVSATQILEVAALSKSFCQMANQLSRSFRSLRESEQKFSTLLDSVPVGVSVFDAEGNLLLVNRQGAAITGQETAPVPAKQISEVYRVYVAGTDRPYPTDQLPAMRVLRGEMSDNNDIEIEVNGRRIPLEVKTMPVIDETGKVIYVINAFQDITDRQQAEQFRLNYARELERQISEKTSALQVSQTKLSDILDNTIATIFNFHLFDDGSIAYQYVSNGCIDLCGYTPKEIIADPELWRSRVHPDDWQSILVPTYHSILNGQKQPPREEFRYRHRDNSLRWIGSRISARWDEAAHAWNVTVVNTDITERKQVELELQKNKELAEAANQAKGNFIANMSHELRSPLNAILGFAHLLKRDPLIPPAQQENAAIIERSGAHLLNIINQVLDLAKIEAKRATLNATDFDLWALLHDVHDLFKLKALDKNVAFCLEQSPDIPRLVYTDEVKLRQVLINLLDNALKFTDRGHVTLRVSISEQSKLEPFHPLNHSTQHHQNDTPTRIQFEVEDSGSGISIVDQQKLFEAFSQTQSGQQKSGTGLGLTISREFVRIMGGDISVESHLGQGSYFRFDILLLTKHLSHDPQPDDCPIIGLAPGQPRYRFLIVDDNPVNRRLLVQLLSVLEVDLQEAANGMDAIALWKDWHPDLIWMDLRMPELDGYEVTRQIRQLETAQAVQSPVIVIGISATGLTNHHEIAIASGCNDFISKPFAESEIFATLKRHLDLQYRYAGVSCFANQAIDETRVAVWINALPEDLQTALKQSVILGYTHQIQDIIHQIETQNPNLSTVFKNLAEEFEYTQILYFLDIAQQTR
jgi:PAS domain S-box-containing protein